MTMQDIVNLILNSGIAVIVVAYFMYRDLKFMNQLQTTLTTLVDTVNCLKEVVEEKEQTKE